MEAKQKRWYLLEALAVLLTGVCKIIFINILPYRLPFIIAACGSWALYIVIRWAGKKGILAEWGLHTGRFKKTFLELLPFAGLLILGFVIFGMISGSSVLDWTIVLILILYPIWGILQQFLVLGLFGRDLRLITGDRFSDRVIIVITAILFAIIHYPEPLLIVGTFLLALAYMYLYLKGRNLIVLGIYHGWLAAFFFYCALGRNSWQEAFGGAF